MSADFRIEHVDRLDCVIEDFHWRLASENAAQVAERWAAEVALKPKMFDGRVLMAHRAVIEERGQERVFASSFFETSYSSFRFNQLRGFSDPDAINCFAMAALRSSDGAFLLGEMGPHTANAGQIYSPAGTPDLEDVVGTKVDLEGSVLRELEEETGLGPEDVRVAPGSILIFRGQQIACMRVLDLSTDAIAAEARMTNWLAAQDQPELTRMHIIRDGADTKLARMPVFMAAFMRYMLRKPA